MVLFELEMQLAELQPEIPFKFVLADPVQKTKQGSELLVMEVTRPRCHPTKAPPCFNSDIRSAWYYTEFVRSKY
jgi:hypothetical protein